MLDDDAVFEYGDLKLVSNHDPGWQGRRHFFGAAAQAMRQILIDQARRKASVKHGGQGQRVEMAEGLAYVEPPAERGEEFCDAATKTHINDTPAYYYSYAIAQTFQIPAGLGQGTYLLALSVNDPAGDLPM